MANTSTRDVSVGVRLPGKRYDRQFFMAMAILLFAVIAIGFAPTYYRAGFFRAPLPSRIVHIHAAVFSSWMLLLLVQTTLISAKRVRWHRQLGMAGFVLACLMVVMGFLIFADLAARVKPLPDSDAILGSLIVPFTDAFDFGVLAAMAYSLRRNPAAHKRLIVIATAGISGAAFFPLAFSGTLPRWLCRVCRVIYLPRDPGSLRSVVDAQAAACDALGKYVSDFHGTVQSCHRAVGRIS
jgi:hypothetical protein